MIAGQWSKRKGPAVRLHLLTWPDVEAYLSRSTGIILPVGSTEQHGLNGLIGTDSLCAEAVANGIGEAAEAVVTPPLWSTPAQFNLGFPGTVSIRASTLSLLVSDIVGSLVKTGFRKIYVVNAHGANLAPINAALHDLRAADDRLSFRVKSWWSYPETNALRHTLYGEAEGVHATPSEVAITKTLYPSRIGTRAEPPARLLPADVRADLAGDNHPNAAAHRAEYPDGRVGSDPALSTAEDGATLLASAVREGAEDYRRFVG